MPQIYVDSDNDATRCYMFFQRMAAKVELINTVVTQAHGLPDALNGPVSEALVGICEVSPFLFHITLLIRFIDERPCLWPVNALQALRSDPSQM